MAYRRLLFGIFQLCCPHLPVLTACAQGDDYTRLPVVDNYEYLRSIRIPDGVYSSAKGNLTKSSRILSGVDGQASEYERSPTLTHPGWVSPTWPVPSSSRGQNEVERPLSSSSSSSSSPTTPSYHSATIYQTNGTTTRKDTSLPRLSTIAPIHQLSPSPHHGGISPTSPYSPLTTEDRRALSSFRIVL